MRLELFHATVVPLSLLGLGGLVGSLWFLSSSFPSPHDCARMVAMASLILGFYRVFLMIRSLSIKNSKKLLPEFPQDSFFNRLGAPLSEELIRLLSIVAIAHATSTESIRSMACMNGALYAIEKQMWSFWLFSPRNYELRYKKFLRYYDMYENATQDSTNSLAALQQKAKSTPCLKNSVDMSYDTECVDCSMEGSRSGTKSPVSLDSLTTLVSNGNLNGSAPLMDVKPEFNLNSFDDTHMIRSYLEPIYCPQRQNESRPDVVDRLYTISPKNTLYLQYENFKLPPKIDLNTVESEHDVSPILLKQDVLVLSNSIHGSDFASISSHYGGGLGGNIEYKFPDGSKLKLGGGGGFDFRRGSKESKTLLNTIKDQAHYLMSSDYRWYCWLYCLHEHVIEKQQPKHVVNATIKKQLSQYTLRNESTPLRVCASSPLYWSLDNNSITDLESGVLQQPVQNAQLFYKFNRFANMYFDVFNYDGSYSLCLVDPAFIRFGVPLRKLSSFYLITYNLSNSLWQIYACITFALPFYMKRCLTGLIAISFMLTFILKLFSANYLHCQCPRSYKFSILVEFLINILMFATIYLVCFFDQ